MNRITLIIGVAIIFLLMVGCKKKDVSTTPGSIYGTVTDFATGEPVKNANVKLRQTGATTLTGSDGMYEFLNVPTGNYNINVSKAEYNDLIDDYVIVVSSGGRVKRDVQIEKLPSALQIMNNDGNIITELDFGGNEGIISKTFKIVNRGTTTLNFRIYKDVEWIESITPNEGTIPVNRDCPIILKIDREKLANGLNTTSIIITSEDGGVELIVKARKGSSGDVFELPAAHLMVQLEDIGCVNWSSASSMCSSSTVAGYNDWRLPTKDELMTLYNNREEIGGFTTGKYWSASTISTSSGTRYYYVNFTNGTMDWDSQWSVFYVRAVRTISQENGVVELPTANLMVQTQDLGYVTWSSAKLLCESSTVGDHDDWRLPTLQELMTLYNNREQIGGFIAGGYWSSSESSSYYYYVNFSTGSYYSTSSGNKYNVRAVRNINGGSVTTPTVTTTTPSNITTNSATCGGNVTSDGGATVTARGVCWSTSQNPTISGSHTTDGTGTGSFTSNITGLAESTTYYVRAYATNSEGTSYGSQKSFTTESGGSSATIPTVTTATPFDIAIYSAACGGNVTSDGGATVFERGICYSTSQNPTTLSYTVQSGSGTGSYTCYMTGLNQSTTYYVRAYAINSEGTAYGNQVSFTTNSEPINGWLYYDDINIVGHAGLNNGGTLYWANMYPPSMLAPYAGTSVVKLEAHLDLTGYYILQIYQGGNDGPSTLLLNDNCYVSEAGGYVTFTFGTPISFDASQNLWVVIGKTHSAGDHPAGYSNLSNDLNSRWCSIDGTNWGDSGYTWILHTYVSNTGEKSGRNLVEIRHTNNDSDIKSTIDY